MNEFFHDHANVWLAAGALIMAFEALTAPGLGLFLGGLGAVCTALLIKLGIVGADDIPAQFAWCFGLTVVWTALLWKPLLTFRRQHGHSQDKVKNNNLIGEIATVTEKGLIPGETGQVSWSGTLWNADLDSPAPLGPGAKVRIHAITGNTLKVKPKEGG